MDNLWTKNGCDQCWTCKNCIGQSKDDHTLPGIENPDVVFLPECKKMEAFMTKVYDRPCRGYEQEGRQMGDKMVFVTTCGDCKYAEPHKTYPEWIKCTGRLCGRIFHKSFFCRAGTPKEAHP
jgi:hypothetical protein